MIRILSKKIFGICAPLLVAFTAGATERTDSTRQQFFDTLATTLHADYRLCTADSSPRQLVFLLKWRQSIDSAVAGADYPAIVRKFSDETGIRAADARPCEIIQWMREFENRRQENVDYLSAERDSLIQIHNDSLYLVHELQSVTARGYDIAGIPFGLPQQALLLLARRNRLVPLVKNPGDAIIFDSIVAGRKPCRAALHFSTENRYSWYELESSTCGTDSLDFWMRPMMDSIAADLEKRTSQPPDHIYRVGRFDIVPGRLAICKLWEFSDAFAYVGLSRIGNRFYAKAIVRAK